MYLAKDYWTLAKATSIAFQEIIASILSKLCLSKHSILNPKKTDAN
jgi:hypothetical protein